MRIALDTLPMQVLWFILPMMRVASMLMVAPVFGSRATPVKVRVGAAVLITLLLYPLLGKGLTQPSVASIVLFTAQELILGLTTGFFLRLVFAAYEVAGTVIATQMGLGFAAINDPQNGGQIPVLSQFFAVTVTLLFLALDGHLLLIKVLATSFGEIPVGELAFSTDRLWRLVQWAENVFSGALLLALPAVAALTVVNLAFGVITRVAPQMNLFAVGFPISLLLGLLLVLFSLPTLLPHFKALMGNTFEAAQSVLDGGAS